MYARFKGSIYVYGTFQVFFWLCCEVREKNWEAQCIGQVQPDQNKSRVDPRLLGKYCGNIARKKSERAPGTVTQHIEVSEVGETWFQALFWWGVCIFLMIVPNASNICKKGISYFRGVLSSLNRRIRLPHLTPFFLSLNLVLAYTEWPSFHQDADSRSCAVVIWKQLCWVHLAQDTE